MKTGQAELDWDPFSLESGTALTRPIAQAYKWCLFMQHDPYDNTNGRFDNHY